MSKLRVCLDARLISGTTGGVEQVIIGLASGLSKLPDDDEEFYFLTYAGADAWLLPYLDGPCRLLQGVEAPKPTVIKKILKAGFPFLTPIWHQARASLGLDHLAVSDGTIERSGIDLMHFTKQDAFLTEVISIYQPHDLMFLHLPEYFNPCEIWRWDRTYRSFCRQARLVAVETEWVKEDLMKHYGLPGDRVAVVNLAPLLPLYPEPSDAQLIQVKEKLSLPTAFFFYPAYSWPHKNHLGLLDALLLLRDRFGLVAQLVCSGGTNDFFKKIEQKARKLKISDQVKFLGFVSPLELQSLYRLCRGVILPSKFEGWGFPLLEAFWAGAPAACSNVTSMPKMASDAALIFDPNSPEEIARAMNCIWTDEKLRQDLIKRGRERTKQFTWERTARLFRAYYRRLANRPLYDQDRNLLSEASLV